MAFQLDHSNHYNSNDSSSDCTKLDTDTAFSIYSSDYNWPSSSISSPYSLPFSYSVELHRSSNRSTLSPSSSRYFKWVRPIARPGRHSSPDDESDINEDGTDDSYLEVECPSRIHSASDENVCGDGSFSEWQQQQQQQGFRSPKIKYFKWARPGRYNEDDEDDDSSSESDMEVEEKGEETLAIGDGSSEDGYYFSDDSKCADVGADGNEQH
ncbi:hypothetical protein BGZ95_004447 [Linnemannia exigua]|uniref:Uncharacterized protein n=1 Tax=Linnemannia exigua TaxID=604196 RepID=A0AAD4D537_9FUNG|nr:hypothetical protein BGZ95_004447 [Linnemannia exigua]